MPPQPKNCLHPVKTKRICSKYKTAKAALQGSLYCYLYPDLQKLQFPNYSFIGTFNLSPVP